MKNTFAAQTVMAKHPDGRKSQQLLICDCCKHQHTEDFGYKIVISTDRFKDSLSLNLCRVCSEALPIRVLEDAVTELDRAFSEREAYFKRKEKHSMTDAAKAERAKYKKAWREKNPDKCKAYVERYWEKKAAQSASERRDK